MSNHRSSRTITLLVAAALVTSTPMLLSGCGLIPNPVEGVIEGVTGGDVNLPGGSVPGDFPSDVPLVDGEVIFGTGFGNDSEKIWNVTIKVGANVIDQIAADLEGAGFASSGDAQIAGDVGTLLYQKDDLNVLVVIAEDTESDGFLANYTVTRGTSE